VSPSRNGTNGRNGTHPSRAGSASGRPRLPATASQVRAIIAIARKQDADLEGVLRADFGVDQPEDLSLSQASKLIDRLKAAAGA
jgi:hypothetical protein